LIAIVVAALLGASPGAWSVLDLTPPAQVLAAGNRNVEVLVRNDGPAAVSGDTLSLHSRWEPEGAAPSEVIAEATLDRDVPAGATTHVLFAFPTPLSSGLHHLRWAVRTGEPVHDGDPSAAMRIERFSGRILSFDSPRWALPGSMMPVKLEVENTGTAAWDAFDEVAPIWSRMMGAKFRDYSRRLPVDRTVKPGERVVVSGQIEVPHNPAFPRPVWLSWAAVRDGQRRAESGGTRWLVLLPPPGRFLLRVLVFAALAFAVRRWRRRAAPPSNGPDWLPPFLVGASVTTLGLCISDFLQIRLEAGHALAFVSASFLVALPCALAPARWKWPTCCATVAFAALFTFADMIHYRAFGTLLGIGAFGGGGQLLEVLHSVRALIGKMDWELLGIPLSTLGFAWAARAPAARSGRSAWVAGAVAVLAIPAVVLALGPLADPSQPVFVVRREALASLGVAGVHLVDAARVLREKLGEPSITPEERARLVQVFVAHKQLADSDRSEPTFGVARGSNVLLVQVEALQEWGIDAEVAGTPVMPFLHGLKGRAMFFSKVFDQTHDGRTSDAEFVTLNSLHPLAEGAAAWRVVGNDFLSLPSVLRRASYETYSFHGNSVMFWNRSVMHPHYGIEHLEFREQLGEGESYGFGLSDRVLFDRAVDVLARAPQPFFAFAITLSSHHPYDYLPESERTLAIGPLRDTMEGRYLEALHYADRQLEHLFSLLDARGLLKNTVVAIYGDHDAGLSDSKNLEHLIGQDHLDDLGWVRLDRVPLFIRVPGESLTGEREVMGGQVDIAPTLLHLLGLPQPPCYLGVPLLGPAWVPAISPMSAAAGPARIWLDAPSGGGCFDRTSLRPLPADACASLATARRDEVEASRWVVEHNEIKSLGCAPL
jgi:phosphoglycerol transferase MdoB-like AlkP superfamily enzyme